MRPYEVYTVICNVIIEFYTSVQFCPFPANLRMSMSLTKVIVLIGALVLGLLKQTVCTHGPPNTHIHTSR